MITTGVLLVNLGSPAAPTAPALRRYLREFLSDPRVVDLPRLLWWPVLHGIVLNTRPRRSAEKYARIWTAEGSPLRVHTERQAKLLRGYLGQAGCAEVAVEWAMRYGEPSIASGLDRLASAGCSRILALPLYPQYSESTTASARDAIDAWLIRRPAAPAAPAAPAVHTLHDFHDDAGYLGALASAVQAHWTSVGRPDRLVISFHGLPQARIAQGDPYQAQCLETARCLAANLGLGETDYLVTFQSRFGPAKWLEPYTQPTLEALARQGTRCVDVICPGFVADCLETLEEIALECRASFLDAGGREFRYLPCLNERHEWIAALADLVRANLNASWER